MGCNWIVHKGRKILLTDYSECKDSESVLKQFLEMAEIVKKTKEPVYTIDLFTGVHASKEFMVKAKEMSPMLREKRVKGVIVGITGIKVMLFQAYLDISDDPLVALESMESALNFLTEDI